MGMAMCLLILTRTDRSVGPPGIGPSPAAASGGLDGCASSSEESSLEELSTSSSTGSGSGSCCNRRLRSDAVDGQRPKNSHAHLDDVVLENQTWSAVSMAR
eukprot:TRINITY_DN1398_c1_g1_i1.p2 TRINITY_DN1398_c1_g1~~TRINITY_DN1398_c1_g1_i1.p2  ORF type:complete len:101 (+),score=3.83 TRINITY_DN1398_c1_g1_i1:2069-2371(+)